MQFQTITSSEGRANFPELLNAVDEKGNIVIITVHGKAKAALIDVDLLNEYIENKEYGISASELKKRMKEPTIGYDELKALFNV